MASALVVPLTASPAAAAVPAPLSVTQTAARDFGNGGPAEEAAVQANAVAVGSDGRVVFYDRRARELRAVDATTHLVSALAGTGAAPSWGTCSPSTSLAPASAPLAPVDQLWVVANGDVYAAVTSAPGCTNGAGLFRLAAADGMWHLALKNPMAGTATTGPYQRFAVDSAGNILAWDAPHYVMRRFAFGDDPLSSGTIVAGVLNTPGADLHGEAGPATSAHLGEVGSIVAWSDGSFALATPTRVRRVGTDGILSTVAGNGSYPPYAQPGADVGLAATSARIHPASLAASATDPTRIYVMNDASPSYAWQAFTVGGVLAAVVGPTAPQTATGARCIGQYTPAAVAGDQLLVTCGFGVRSWPVDGSAALQDGTRVAGVDDAKGFDASPDGVPLSRAFLSVSSIAQAPHGALAIAASGAIRTLAGLSASDTLGTLTTALSGVSAVAYGTDGTLYATTAASPGIAQGVYAVSPAGVVTQVLGGGSSGPIEGAAGTSISQVGSTALDAVRGLLYFAISSPPQVWSLDLSAHTLHHVAGNDGTGFWSEGAAAVDQPLGVAPMLAADASTGAVYLTFGSTRLVRVDGDGTIHTATPADGGLYLSVVALPNGVLVSGPTTIAPDGTRASVLKGINTAFGVASDNRVVGRPVVPSGGLAPEAGGLLAVSAPVPAPVFPEALPAVQLTPGPGNLTLAVTPGAGTTQRLDVYAGELYSNGTVFSPSYVGTVPNDGSGTSSQTTYVSLGGAGPVSAGHQYRIVVVASVDDGQTSAVAPAVTVEGEPLVDTTGPAVPGLTVTANGSSVRVQITAPTDPDFHHMVVRYAVGGVAPASPSDGTLARTSYGSEHFFVDADPAKTYSFSAFAFDNSGNASGAGTGQRPAATLASGAAATNVPYAAGAGCTWLVASSLVRYSSGTVAPATPADGTSAGSAISTTWGSAYCVPVAAGAQVAVSLFTWTDSLMTQFRRTSVVLTGGVSGDRASLAATSLVTYGSRPVVKATLVRNFATGGSMPLAAKAVDLYRRPVGTSTWTKVSTVTTSSTGTASFVVPIPTGHVDYQARSTGILDTIISSSIRRTSVRQTLTLAQSATSVRHGYAVSLYGTVGPKRAARVYLQRYVSGRWVNLTYLSSATTGAYKFSYKPPTVGTYVLRTYVAGTTKVLAANSPTRTVKAT